MMKATSITLTYASGLASNLQTKELTREQFPNIWWVVDVLLTQWSYLVDGHCDDVDFTVTYEDGEVYSGTIGIYADRVLQERLGTHIRNFCLMFGGRKRPKGLDDAGYQEFMKGYGEEALYYQKMLDCYEIG